MSIPSFPVTLFANQTAKNMKEIILECKVRLYDYGELTATERQLIEAAKRATQTSYAPYSHFRVGAAVRLVDGSVITGSNQENAAYPSGLCAERTTLFYANAHCPDTAVEMLAIAAHNGTDFTDEPVSPCGACRQVILETERRFHHPIRLLLYGRAGVYVVEGVHQLLPLSFTDEQL